MIREDPYLFVNLLFWRAKFSKVEEMRRQIHKGFRPGELVNVRLLHGALAESAARLARARRQG